MAQRKRRRRRTGRAQGPLLLLLIGGVLIGALLLRANHASQHRAAPVIPVESTVPANAPVEASSEPVPSQAPTPQQSPEPAGSATPARPVATPTGSALPAAGVPGAHRLAIIIDDCGQWPKTERALIALPISITMSVMPKERYSQTIAQEANAAGKGVMLHLPMEPVAAIDPGRGKITTAMSDAQIVAQVKDDVAQMPLAKGVNNHEGSKASADPRVMKAVASALAPDGLFFIDSRTSAASIAAQVAAEAGMRTASRDVFLDNSDNVDAVKTMLREAAATAMKNGSAIAIGHPRAATLEAIRSLIPELQAQGIAFVPAADLVH
ncbi:MAG: divergent polysaccharide deacetylase family protein [Candidatus Eremiobacteraeota bacterium]|nr:divergent polysaccharide deacetylase family protein [Candidatus Eremiobacteraeota bacterium]